MKIRILLSAVVPAVVSAFVAGCINTATPTEVTKDYLEAVKTMDFDTVAALSSGKMSEDAKKGAEELAKLKKSEKDGDKTAREKMVMVAKIEGIFENISYKPECEKIDGDFAVVDVLANLEGKTATTHVYLKKVDGKWKVINKADYPKSEPAQAAPAKTEPKKAECKKDAAKKAEPAKAECKKAECKKDAVKKAEPAKAECKKAECKKAEPAKAEPKKTECKKAEPAKAEPKKAEPAK